MSASIELSSHEMQSSRSGRYFYILIVWMPLKQGYVNKPRREIILAATDIHVLRLLALTMILSSFLITLTVLVLCLYVYLIRHFNYWKKRGIPYIEPLPLFGNLKEVFLQRLNYGDLFRRLYNEHKHFPYVGIFAVDRPGLLVNDLDIIRNILVKDWQHFPDHIIDGDIKSDPIFQRIIFLLKGESWKFARHKLTPTFTSGKMKVMFHLVDNCAKQLSRLIETSTADGKLMMKLKLN